MNVLRRHWWLGIILLFAGAIRFWGGDGIGSLTLWTDEMFSLQSSAGRGFWVEDLPRGEVMSPPVNPTSLEEAGPLWGIYWGQSKDTNPPGFYMVLRLWRDLVGSSRTTLRALSLVWGLVAVAGMYAAGVAMGGRRMGILAAMICALAGSQVIYSREVRGYEMACGLVCVAAACLLWIDRGGWRPWRGWLMGISSGLAIGTIYLAALPVAAMGIYATLCLKGSTRWKTLATGIIGVGIFALLLTPLLFAQRTSIGMRNQFLVAEEPRTLSWVAKDAAAAMATQIAPLQERSAAAAYFAAGLLVVGAIPLWIWCRGSRLWLVWLAGAIGALVLMDLSGNKTHLNLPRYTMLAGPAVIGIALAVAGLDVRGISPRVRKLLWSIPLGTLIYAAISLPATFSIERSMKEDWTILTDFAAQHAKPNDLWVVGGYGGRKWDHILYLGLLRNRPETQAVGILDQPETDVTELKAEAVRRGGLVLFAEDGTTLEKVVPEGWKAAGFQKLPTVGAMIVYRPAN